MYFRAFRESHKSSLAPNLIYTVERIVSQMLAAADVNALTAAVQKGSLADVLVDELSFLGQVSRSDLPKVRDYLLEQQSTLMKSARRLVREPDNDALREELCAPPQFSAVRG